MRTEEITRLAEFLTELATATESGRKFCVEYQPKPSSKWYKKDLDSDAQFVLWSEYRIAYEAREWWVNIYPATSEVPRQWCIWDTEAEANVRKACGRIACIPVREVLDET